MEHSSPEMAEIVENTGVVQVRRWMNIWHYMTNRVQRSNGLTGESRRLAILNGLQKAAICCIFGTSARKKNEQ